MSFTCWLELDFGWNLSGRGMKIDPLKIDSLSLSFSFSFFFSFFLPSLFFLFQSYLVNKQKQDMNSIESLPKSVTSLP